MYKNKTIFRLFVLVALGWLGMAQVLYSQQVSGEVTDGESGESLPGVNIVVKGTAIGTSTDLDGNFSLDVPSLQDTLVFSYIGYQAQEVQISGRRTVNVELQPQAITGEELVVVGYSSQQRRDMTGSIAVVDMDQFEARGASGDMVSKQLQGMASGVSVISSGQPGESPTLRIRGVNTFGNNSPLVVVDGVPGDINSLNSNDIESIQVLKDASSASIYGARAANGVIVITTRQGRGAVQVDYSGTYSIDWQGRTNPFDIASPKDQAEIWHTALTNSGIPHSSHGLSQLYGSGDTTVLPDYIAPAGAMEGEVDLNDYFVVPEYTDPNLPSQFYRITRANKEGTDWFNELFRPASSMQHNISVSGGGEIGNYLFSLNYLQQEGTMQYTHRDQLQMRTNTAFNVGEDLRVGQNLYFTLSESPTAGTLGEGSPISHASRMHPIVPVYDVMGNFAGHFGTGLGNPSNPVHTMYRTRNNDAQNRNLRGNIFAELDLMDRFHIRTNFGGSLLSSSSRSISYPTYENEVLSTNHQVSAGSSAGYDWTWTNTIQYTESFGKHDVELLAGMETFRTESTSHSGSITDFYSLDLNYVSLSNGADDESVSGGSISEHALLSYFSRLDYIFDDRYILGATLRRDGSSRLQNNRWGWFPSVSVGWRISQERFMQGIEWLTDLRLFAGYGVMGNENVSVANAFTVFSTGSQTSVYAIDGNNTTTPAQGFRLGRIGNPDARWEENVTANTGFDISLFEDRFRATVEYYWKDVNDLLFSPELIGSAGQATAPAVNIAHMKNQGLDMSVTTLGSITDNLQYDVTLTFTSYNNEIGKISNDADFFDQSSRRFTTPLIRNQVGHPVSAFYGYQIIGFWQEQSEIDAANANLPEGVPEYQQGMAVGRFRYADMDGNGYISAEDRTFLGDPHPDFTYGINLGLNYRAFDFSMFWYGSQGNDLWNQVKWWNDFYASFDVSAKSNTLLYDSWTPDNRNATAPILENVSSFSTSDVPNSYFVEDGSYLRLKSIQLGYTFSSDILQYIGLRNLRAYVQGNNLVTFTGYSGPDPEIGGGTTTFGVDEGQYVSPRQVLFGLNISF